MRRLTWLLLAAVALLGSLAGPVGAQPEIERLAHLPAGEAAYGLAVNAEGQIYVGETGGLRDGTIYVYSPSGELQDRIAIQAGSTGLVSLRGLTFDRAGNLYVADAANGLAGRGRILRISPRGRQSVFASGLNAPNGLVVDRAGVLYVTDGIEGAVVWIAPDGASASFVEDDRLRPHSRRGLGASGLAFAPGESALYISNVSDDRVYRLSIGSDGAAGRLSLFVDADLRGSRSTADLLDGPDGLAVDSRGNVLVAATLADEVEVFSPEGRLLGRAGGNDGRAFAAPTALSLSPSGRWVYVASLAADNGYSFFSRFALADLLND